MAICEGAAGRMHQVTWVARNILGIVQYWTATNAEQAQHEVNREFLTCAF